jgi:hypothetical protein
VHTANLCTRFLLRASAFLLCALTLWYWVLAGPMTTTLLAFNQIAMKIFLGADANAVENASGDWNFRVPTDVVTNGSKIRSIEFSIAREGLLIFTFSLPVYWATALATLSAERRWRRLLLGTVVGAVIGQLCLLGYVQMSAISATGQWQPERSRAITYLLMVGSYMIARVIPYVAPFIVLLIQAPELRRQIFPWELEEPHEYKKRIKVA